MDNLLGEPTILQYIKKNIVEFEDCVVVSPDSGGVKRCTSVADALGLGFAIIHKGIISPAVACNCIPQ